MGSRLPSIERGGGGRRDVERTRAPAALPTPAVQAPQRPPAPGFRPRGVLALQEAQRALQGVTGLLEDRQTANREEALREVEKAAARQAAVSVESGERPVFDLSTTLGQAGSAAFEQAVTKLVEGEARLLAKQGGVAGLLALKAELGIGDAQAELADRREQASALVKLLAPENQAVGAQFVEQVFANPEQAVLKQADKDVAAIEQALLAFVERDIQENAVEGLASALTALDAGLGLEDAEAELQERRQDAEGLLSQLPQDFETQASAQQFINSVFSRPEEALRQRFVADGIKRQFTQTLRTADSAGQQAIAAAGVVGGAESARAHGLAQASALRAASALAQGPAAITLSQRAGVVQPDIENRIAVTNLVARLNLIPGDAKDEAFKTLAAEAITQTVAESQGLTLGQREELSQSLKLVAGNQAALRNMRNAEAKVSLAKQVNAEDTAIRALAEAGSPEALVRAKALVAAGGRLPAYETTIIGIHRSALGRGSENATALQKALVRYQSEQLSPTNSGDKTAANLAFDVIEWPDIEQAIAVGDIEGAVQLSVTALEKHPGIFYDRIEDQVFTSFFEDAPQNQQYAVSMVNLLEEHRFLSGLMETIPKKNSLMAVMALEFQQAGMTLSAATEKARLFLQDQTENDIAGFNETYRRGAFGPNGFDEKNRKALERAFDPGIFAFGAEVEGQAEFRMNQAVRTFFPATRGEIKPAQEMAIRQMKRDFGPTTIGLGPDADPPFGGVVVERPAEGALTRTGLSRRQARKRILPDLIEFGTAELRDNAEMFAEEIGLLPGQTLDDVFDPDTLRDGTAFELVYRGNTDFQYTVLVHGKAGNVVVLPNGWSSVGLESRRGGE